MTSTWHTYLVKPTALENSRSNVSPLSQQELGVLAEVVGSDTRFSYCQEPPLGRDKDYSVLCFIQYTEIIDLISFVELYLVGISVFVQMYRRCWAVVVISLRDDKAEANQKPGASEDVSLQPTNRLDKKELNDGSPNGRKQLDIFEVISYRRAQLEQLQVHITQKRLSVGWARKL